MRHYFTNARTVEGVFVAYCTCEYEERDFSLRAAVERLQEHIEEANAREDVVNPT